MSRLNRRFARWRTGMALAAGVLSVAAGATPARAYPPADGQYLDYAEMVAAIQGVEASRPDIVDLFSIGRSSEGRQLWAAKVSDNVATDEDEPEVALDGGIHGREHLSTEMTVRLLRELAQGHGTDPRLTRLVDETEVFIFFNLNPDGSEFDHASGIYQEWRKNRQPTPGSTAIGTDVNRNFEYRWGTNPLNASPSAETYRGPAAWSTPEAAAFRDWVNGRVRGGEQQLKVHVTFHQYGRVVLYPYGYTTDPAPADMTADDHAVLETMAAEMGRRSGYASAQSSAWAGINVGNQMDWLYGAHRIMTFTVEMGDTFYMGPEAIATETGRNLDAAYYAIEQASCPQGVIGLADVYCDPSGFVDIAASPFRSEIRWAAESGITRGCASDRFCPLAGVTREQAASFLARALDLPPPARDWFTDDAGSGHEADINRIADAGFTIGCGGTRYCPTATVTREQMASFLRRAYSLPATGTDFFADDAASGHQDDINRLAASGITRGCAADRFCPLGTVTREQMVTFLYRAEQPRSTSYQPAGSR